MNDITVAASERAFVELFNGLRDSFTFADGKSTNFGPFAASYNVALHLEGGTIDLRDDNSVQIKELDIKWDTLEASIGVDIPQVCVGGFCIIPNPFGGCLVRAPRICLFSDNPDLELTLPLSGLLTSEVSFTARPLTRSRIDPARTPAMSDLDAADANVANKWQVFIDPLTIDLDPFDFADIVGDLLENALDNAINSLLGPFPRWAKALVRAILGPVIDLVRTILDIPDDIGEWLSDLIGVSLGLFNTLVTFIADYFASRNPLYEFEDPYPILPANPFVPLIPVSLPVRSLTAQVNDTEMILAANIGA